MPESAPLELLGISRGVIDGGGEGGQPEDQVGSQEDSPLSVRQVREEHRDVEHCCGSQPVVEALGWQLLYLHVPGHLLRQRAALCARSVVSRCCLLSALVWVRLYYGKKKKKKNI
jgi:hypothetical protein